jgi:hypothetical protein
MMWNRKPEPGDVWYAIPSANAEQCAATFAVWQARGYKTAVLVDGNRPFPDNADLIVRAPIYRGYGASVNLLCSLLPDVDWVCTGGDDILPDPDHDPKDIARQCAEHFNGTYGVMQPVGDRWLNACIEKFAGSPWMGREWRRRINQGRGPIWEEYGHFYDDCEHKAVAEREGVYWMRSDLIHLHEHWTKKNIPRPAYLVDKGAREPISRSLFEQRRSAGFPGSEPLPA